MVSRWVVALVAGACAAVAWGAMAPLVPGKIYEAGAEVESTALGLGLTIPEDFRGVLPADADILVLESGQAPANIFLYADKLTMSQLENMMASAVVLDPSLVLEPTGEISVRDGWLYAEYSVRSRPELVAGIRAQTGPAGIAIGIIAVAGSEAFAFASTSAEALSRSIEYSEPSVPAPPAVDSWQDYLRGRYIVRYYMGSGYYENEHLWLCSDGRYFRSSQSGGGGNTGMDASGAYSGRAEGTWRADGTLDGAGTLLLKTGPSVFSGSAGVQWSETMPGDRIASWQLRLAENKLYLDDKRWLRDANQRCR